MRITGGFIALCFLIITARAVYLQVFCRSYLSRQASVQYEKNLVSQGKRGIIYDKNYREMAVSIRTTSVAAYPPAVEAPSGIAALLALDLHLDKDDIAARLNSKRRFVWIKRQVTPREKSMVQNRRLPGIDFVPEHARYYPHKNLAAQLMGFTGIDGHGLEGIEFYYDAYLKGDTEKYRVFQDALGQGFVGDLNVEMQKRMPNESGNNLVLTIDRTIQFIAEEALKKGVLDFEAKSGIAIVMVPRTGALLAVAHYPFFNPNDFGQFKEHSWRNRAMADSFEPGSPMKIFCAASALESGICTPNTIFFCENGKYKIGKDTIHDTQRHGWLSMKKIIKHSSNIGTVKISELIGAESLYNTLRAFGFGEKTGVDCPGESPGSLTPYRQWSPIDTSTIAFGYGIAVSPIQLITAVSAIANGGSLMKPYVVQAVTDPNGRHVQSFGPCRIRRAVSENTASMLRKMMQSVIESGGTGENARVDGYIACGKTGTAKKIDKTGEYEKTYTASFIGFAPASHPEIAVLVVIDEPETGYYGGIVAAPVFKTICRETLNYLDVPPEIPSHGLTAFLDRKEKNKP